MVRPWPAKPLPPVRIWVPPLLYLVSSPIGNLGDFSLRAREVLAQSDYVLCEDTRTSRILLRHYEIDVPLKSLHAHNERRLTPSIVRDLEKGKVLALLSDAGTPTLSDPGAHLVATCCNQGIAVCPIPGPSACLAALVASGLNPSRFQFLGFLPKRPGKAKKMLRESLEYPGTTILYESPHRLLSTLEQIATLDPCRRIVVAREITKLYETFLRGSALELLETYRGQTVRGECVILIDENSNSC